MQELEELKKEIELLKTRNKKVEANKAWETSLTRKLTIMLITYLTVGITLSTMKNPNPWINAIIPTLGFLLSTLTIPFMKMSGKNTSTTTKEYQRALPALAVIFNEQGKVLLTKRDEPTSPLHNLWQFPGGGIEFGEHPRQTVIREIKEETNLEIQLLTNHPLVFHHANHEQQSETLALVYSAQYISGKINTTQDEHTAEARWFTYEELDFTKCALLTEEILNEVLTQTKHLQKNQK